jgi:hypothetical protein
MTCNRSCRKPRTVDHMLRGDHMSVHNVIQSNCCNNQSSIDVDVAMNHYHVALLPKTVLALMGKRFRSTEHLPSCILQQFGQYMPHNTYLYLHGTDRELVCCQQALFSACGQCGAVCMHAARLWSCLRIIRSPADEDDEARYPGAASAHAAG